MSTIGIHESVASEAAVLERPPSASPAANQIPRDGSPWSPAQVLALQRTGGNAVVGRLLEERQSLQRACCGSCASGHRCESEEDQDVDDRGRRALSASVVARAAVSQWVTQARGTAPATVARCPDYGGTCNDGEGEELEKQLARPRKGILRAAGPDGATPDCPG